MMADDSRATAVIEASAVVRAADLVTARIRAARSSSKLLALAANAVAPWAALSWRGKRLVIGLVLIIAPAVHLLLSLSSSYAQPGWFWLIIPGMSAAVGAVFVAASGVFGIEKTPH
jgi:hypothetical protein